LDQIPRYSARKAVSNDLTTETSNQARLYLKLD
jgi:hypothetical protein